MSVYWPGWALTYDYEVEVVDLSLTRRGRRWRAVLLDADPPPGR